MADCNGRTISPANRVLRFTLDENSNPSPPQSWSQLWSCCPGRVQRLDEDDNLPNFSDEVLTVGEEDFEVMTISLTQSSAFDFQETAFTFFEGEHENEYIPVLPGGRCSSYRREVRVSLPGAHTLTTGEERLCTKMVCGNCSTRICINLSTTGKNPSKSLISAALGTDTLRAIAWQESRWRQFGSDGKPLANRNSNGTADWGIMQINQGLPIHRWNWRENIARGAAILAEKRRHATVYLNRHAPYTDDMLEKETLQRYNGGAYHKWDPVKKEWVEKPPNGYVKSVMKIIVQKPW